MSGEERRAREYQQQELAARQHELGLGAAQAFSGGFDRDENRDLVEYVTNYRDLKEKIERHLKGEALVSSDDGKKSVWKPVGDPIIRNSKGISKLMGKIEILLNDNDVFNVYDDAELRSKTIFISKALVCWFADNAVRYDVDMLEVDSTIKFIAKKIYDVGTRSLSGKEREYAYRANPVNVRYGQYDAGTKEGFFRRNFR